MEVWHLEFLEEFWISRTHRTLAKLRVLVCHRIPELHRTPKNSKLEQAIIVWNRREDLECDVEWNHNQRMTGVISLSKNRTEVMRSI